MHFSRPGPALAAAGGPPGRVLLVEDDPDAALFFGHVLTRQGSFDVTHVPDPCAAFGIARRERWDLVVTDLDLPGMTGLELLAALRRAVPALPVLLVSARDPHQLPAAVPAPDALLAKPVPAARLLAVAAALTANRGRQSGAACLR